MPSISMPSARISRINEKVSFGLISYEVAGFAAAFVAGKIFVIAPSRPASNPQHSVLGSRRACAIIASKIRFVTRTRESTHRVYIGRGPREAARFLPHPRRSAKRFDCRGLPLRLLRLAPKERRDVEIIRSHFLGLSHVVRHLLHHVRRRRRRDVDARLLPG